jgi:putative ABC transport system permease protein
MSLGRLIIQSFRFFFWKNMTVVLAVAIATAVITGALMVGDSVKHSLQQGVSYRLGDISHSITAGEKFFTQALADRIRSEDLSVSLAILLKGNANAGGGEMRVNQVHIWGLDRYFSEVSGAYYPFDSIPENTVVISQNLAKRLNLEEGSSFVLKIEKASLMPLNTPFVAEDDQIISRRVKIHKIASNRELARFGMKNSQTAPFNIFVSIAWVNKIMELDARANHLFLRANNTPDVYAALNNNILPEDMGLLMKISSDSLEWVVGSEQVFIDQDLSMSIKTMIPTAEPVLTYFANSIRYKNSTVPYSFVSSKGNLILAKDEIIVNDWLAEDLSIAAGDTIHLDYYVIGPLRDLDEQQISFVVKDIIALDDQAGDESLVPDIPGLSNTEKCSEWETGIPIDLEAIRDKDEEYWNSHGGTPKAFVSLGTAWDLWRNRFGSYTGFTFGYDQYTQGELQQELLNAISPDIAGFKVEALKEEAIYAAANGTDFSQLFVGLSFFIIVSGLLLTSLLFLLNLEQRKAQIGHFSALGFGKKTIRKVYLWEGFGMAFLGSILGLFLALAYNKLVFYGLNRVWQDIVRTDVLEILVTPKSLISGFFISMIVAMSTVWISLNRILDRTILKNQSSKISDTGKRTKWIIRGITTLMFLASIGLTAAEIFSGRELNPGTFFGIGGMLLVASILLFYLLLGSKGKSDSMLTVSSLALASLKRNSTRSLVVVMLLTIGTFLVVSTGANRKNLFANADEKTSGTGGFLLMAESTLPVLVDLNNPSVKKELDLPSSLDMVQARVREGDDASCLNLNRISNARILGINTDLLEGRFSFATQSSSLEEEISWSSLQKRADGLIPAIADQTVIQWGLGKKPGDTLSYLNEQGSEIHLLLIAGLAASIFQGNIIIDEHFFLEEFPSVSGSNWYLIDGLKEDRMVLETALNSSFRDYGFDISGTAEKLAEFKSVENTYLTIFLVLGAIGLVLGTIGLAVVLARSVLERRKELAIMIATGISVGKIVRIVMTEYSYIILYAIVAGTGTALLAVLPALLNITMDISISFILWLIFVIVVNAMVWAWLIASFQIRRLSVIEALRND